MFIEESQPHPFAAGSGREIQVGIDLVSLSLMSASNTSARLIEIAIS